MTGNRKLRCTDHRGNLNETTENLRKLEVWLGFVKWILWLALLIFLGMDNSTP